MTPLDQCLAFVRRSMADGYLTREGVQQLRQLVLHAVAHDFDPAIRQKLADALADPPDARSFATDSGIGASRAR